MKRLPEIAGTYAKLDQHLETCRLIDPSTASRIESQQILNDQAYFLLCWGQLEKEIDERCRAAIRLAQQSSEWRRRRGWDIYNPDDRRLSGLSFEDRTAIVLDRAAGKGSSYAQTMLHYGTRNEIAHGKLKNTRIDIAAVVQEFFGIQAALAP